MKVVKKVAMETLSLKDYFTKTVHVMPNCEVERTSKIDDGFELAVGIDYSNEWFEIYTQLLNEQAGIYDDVKLYSIPLFGNKEKERIRIPEVVGVSIIELLQNYEISVKQYGNGYVNADTLLNEQENIRVWIWISNDFKFMSITRKIEEPKDEELVGKEYILDKLGL